MLKENYSMLEAIASSIISRKKLPVGIDMGDLVSWGVEGLYKAHKSFDDSKGTTFKTYAYYRIKGEMLDKIRKEWKYRFPQSYKEQHEQIQNRIADIVENMMDAEETGGSKEAPLSLHDIISNAAMTALVSLENVDEILDDNQDEEQEGVSEDIQDLNDEIKTLEGDEKEIIQLFYSKNKTQKEIASILKYSPSKVCRIHHRALEKLKRRMERKRES